MQPYTVLIASVLKPVDDIRMSRKIGLSVARLTQAQVHVAGFCTSYLAQLPPLILHPLFCFSRLSFSRALANLKIIKLGLQLKPRLLIIATHELLPAAAFLRLALGTKVVYDVQENYYRNIRFTPAFPAKIRLPLAALVRGIEYATQPVIDHYLLAEKAYFKELEFVGHKATILENKFLEDKAEAPGRALPVFAPNAGVIWLLYSGTIALDYGILEAIALAEKLHQTDNRFQLHIIGYAPQAGVLEQVRQAIKGKSYIKLTGGEKPVPHPEILNAISEAHFGLLAYRKNPSLDNCIPTKLYEYLANGLPVISNKNPLWDVLLQKWNAGITIDFNQPDSTALADYLLQESFYTNGLPTGVTWEEEEPKLGKVLKNLGLRLTETKV